MQRLTLFAVILMLLVLASSAQAEKSYCHVLSEGNGYDIKTCKCGRNLKSYPLVGTPAFPLVAVCGYSQESWGTNGGFYFVGNIDLSGKITREETTSLGDTLEFSLNESLRKKLPSYLWNLRLSETAIKKFGVPPINSKVPCWSAQTSIRLTVLDVTEGPGTDNDGSFAIDYVVSKVGSFKKCKASN